MYLPLGEIRNVSLVIKRKYVFLVYMTEGPRNVQKNYKVKWAELTITRQKIKLKY